jgi:syntaxin-binding protein 1
MKVIESISNHRDPQPEFEAVYLLMPTSQNVERIIKDFSNHRQYAAAHLFFTDGVCVIRGRFVWQEANGWLEGLSEHLFQRLTASAAEPYLQGLKELFLNFWGALLSRLRV